MDEVTGLRPFVPARDFALSKRFYAAVGFELAREGEAIAIFQMERFSFILQNFYVEELAHNFMIQLAVRDVEAWWQKLNAAKLVADFAVQPPRPPALQPWGLKVGYIFDPSGVLWHVAETAG
jgi:hypothetical protein